MRSIIVIGLIIIGLKADSRVLWSHAEGKLNDELKVVNVELWKTRLDLTRRDEDLKICLSNCAYYLKQADGEIERLKEEIDRLQKLLVKE